MFDWLYNFIKFDMLTKMGVGRVGGGEGWGGGCDPEMCNCVCDSNVSYCVMFIYKSI